MAFLSVHVVGRHGVGVRVGAGVCVGTGVPVGVGVAVAVRVAVGVRVAFGVGVRVLVGVLVGSHLSVSAVTPDATSRQIRIRSFRTSSPPLSYCQSTFQV